MLGKHYTSPVLSGLFCLVGLVCFVLWFVVEAGSYSVAQVAIKQFAVRFLFKKGSHCRVLELTI